MINNKHFLYTTLVVCLALSIVACKKHKDDPAPVQNIPPLVAPVPIKTIYAVEIYNQGLDTVNQPGKKFYNITQQTYSNGLKSPIELAYVYYQPADNSTKHVLGCAKSLIVKGSNGIPSSNNAAVEFYTINSSNNSDIFDTITLSKSMATIFAAKATLSIFQGENDAIASDGFGWDKGEILGFKLTNGKRGLIKLTTIPTGSKDPNGAIYLGKMRFDIKMEM